MCNAADNRERRAKRKAAAPPEVPSHQVCRGCGADKHAEDLHLHFTAATGLRVRLP